MRNEKLREKIKESITNNAALGQLPADEVQLNLDVVYNSILDEICSIVPMNSVRQIIQTLVLCYGTKQKALDGNSKDVVDTIMMNKVGAMPLDEYGYPTDTVKLEVTKVPPVIFNVKNIVPGTLKIYNKTASSSGDRDLIDDGNGNIVPVTHPDLSNKQGTINYYNAILNVNASNVPVPFEVTYKFDNDIETSRIFAYFKRATKEMFAEIYQLDVDSALVLNDFKGVNLAQNIEKILPEVLAQQIDGNIISRYFDQLLLSTTHVVDYDATVDWNNSTKNISVTQQYEDLGTLVGMEMGAFTKRTGVVPNVIICDANAFNMFRVSRGFESIVDEATFSGTPKRVGTFSTAKVFVAQNNNRNMEQGEIVITYKGASDAQAAGVYAPFIPVTLRTVAGAEGGGMIVTNNIYSIGGFSIINPDLVSGINIKNINLPG